MLNAPYPSCHAKERIFGNASWIHLDDFPLTSCTDLAMDDVAGRDTKNVDVIRGTANRERLHLVLL